MSVAVPGSLQILRDQVRRGAQNRPGVYRMLGPRGTILYIGKSKRLRTRLLGYFRAQRQEKAARIIREAHALEWEYAPNEFESLLQELELIKRYRPPFNVRQKRDVSYSFLKLTAGPAPRFHVVRGTGGEQGRYFGPFRGGRRVAAAIRELNDVLQLRDCAQRTPIHFADQKEFFATDRNPLCARYELRLCAGPCAARCTEAEYRGRVEQARAFLEGESDEPVHELNARMQSAAEGMHFEHAALLRDRITLLEEVRGELLHLRETIERLTFAYAIPGAEGEHRIYAIRSGSVRGSYPAPRDPREREELVKRIAIHYADPEPEVDFSNAGSADQIFLVAHWFRTHPQELGSTYASGQWDRLPLADQLIDPYAA